MTKTTPDTAPLRLLATDADDLTVIAAALQDAVGRIGDIVYEPYGKRLTMALNRFRWERDDAAALRVRSAVQFGGVLNVSGRRLRQDAPDAVISVLTVSFTPGEPPGGEVIFLFSGGGELKLTVECIDAAMTDLDASWPVPRAPQHDET
jgi:hypothetical protein